MLFLARRGCSRKKINTEKVDFFFYEKSLEIYTCSVLSLQSGRSNIACEQK